MCSLLFGPRGESGVLRRFDICRDWLEESGYAIQSTQAHKQVWDAFKQAAQADDATAPDSRLVGQHGTTLRTFSDQADYDDRVNQLAPGRDRDGGACCEYSAGAPTK